MRVVVTGGSGFIGKATCAALEMAGHDAVPFDREHGQDILTSELPDCDAVIHLAGLLGTDELFDDPHRAVEVNVTGTLLVLQQCVRLGAGYVGITMPPSPWRNLYAATKGCAVHLASAWHREYRLPVSHVRAFNAYGPGQKHGPGHPRKIIPDFSTRAWTGQPIEIWGDGEQTVDLVHVDQLARMLVDALAYGNDETFDGGTGHELTVNQVADLVAGAVPHRVDVVHRPMRRGETDGTKIVADGEGWNLLGWRPELSYDDLADTIRSYGP